MRMYTIYDNPKDFPGKVVARGCTIGAGSVTHDAAPLYVGPSEAEARSAIFNVHPGAVRLERDPRDEPQIVEVWL